MYNSRITPSIDDMRHLEIPLSDISLATDGFSDKNLIEIGGFGKVYKGVSKKHGDIAVKKLDRGQVNGQGDHEFKTEIAMLSKYKHKNIVSLRGFCDKDGEKILVYKYESNMSLDKHLNNKNLTYTQRLHICLDAALGLSHIHVNDGSQRGIFHRDVKSANILLDKNWNAKISDFGLSRVGLDMLTQSSYVISSVCGTPRHIAPEYYADGYLTAKADVYSFGIVLWEVLCGRHLVDSSYKDDRRSLFVLARKHYKKGTLDSIIPSYLQKQMKPASLLKFANIANQCLKNVEERPTMKQVVKQLKEALHLQESSGLSLSILEVKQLQQLQQIPLHEIPSATNKFGNKNVRKAANGKLSHGKSEKYGHIVIRRMGRGLGNLEFMKEIAYLAERKDDIVVPFLGYCDKGWEKIIVYRYPTNGSLDQRLGDPGLSYFERLWIARDLARGIKHLNDFDDIDHIVNRQFNCSDIFLDEDMKPEVFDFGFPSLFPSNVQSHSGITDPFDTHGHKFPDDFIKGDLRHKLGVYSVGVVMWELLCGRSFTSDKDDPQSLLNLVREHYENQTLRSIIPSYLFEQINRVSLANFSSIAYRCLSNKEEERPTLLEIEEKL